MKPMTYEFPRESLLVYRRIFIHYYFSEERESECGKTFFLARISPQRNPLVDLNRLVDFTLASTTYYRTYSRAAANKNHKTTTTTDNNTEERSVS